MSAQVAREDINLEAVANTAIDPNLVAGKQLLTFADALLGSDASALDAARAALQDVVGAEGATRAAMVIGNFEMMNRLLDATGVPVPASMGLITRELGLPDFNGRH